MTKISDKQLAQVALDRSLTLAELKKKLKRHGVSAVAIAGGIQDKLRALRRAETVDEVAFLIQGDPRATVRDVAIRARNRINGTKDKATKPRKPAPVAAAVPVERSKCVSFAGFNERSDGKYEATATLIDTGASQSPRYFVRVEWRSMHDTPDAASDAFHARCNVLRRAV